MHHGWQNRTTFFNPAKEEYLMEDIKEDIPKEREVESFLKGKDQLEEDQLLKELHEVSIPTLEDKVARVGMTQIAEMYEHIRNGHIPKTKDCPICQQSQGPV
eukprot:3947321-Prorocentrum_lima.AAC.1